MNAWHIVEFKFARTLTEFLLGPWWIFLSLALRYCSSIPSYVWLDIGTTFFNFKLCDIHAFHSVNDGVDVFVWSFNDWKEDVWSLTFNARATCAIGVIGWLVDVVINVVFTRLTKLECWLPSWLNYK
jgi:hypothetical protein